MFEGATGRGDCHQCQCINRGIAINAGALTGWSPLMPAPWQGECHQCRCHDEGDRRQCPRCLCRGTRMKKCRNSFVSTKINFRLDYKKLIYHLLQFNFITKFCQKMKNWEKVNFIQDQEGHKGGDRRAILHKAFFVLTKQIFCEHLRFFLFWNHWLFFIAKKNVRKN